MNRAVMEGQPWGVSVRTRLSFASSVIPSLAWARRSQVPVGFLAQAWPTPFVFQHRELALGHNRSATPILLGRPGFPEISSGNPKPELLVCSCQPLSEFKL